MALARICDRCGVICPDNLTNVDEVAANGISWIVHDEYNCVMRKVVDLCPGCIKDLQTFLHTGMPISPISRPNPGGNVLTKLYTDESY